MKNGIMSFRKVKSHFLTTESKTLSHGKGSKGIEMEGPKCTSKIAYSLKTSNIYILWHSNWS